MKRKRFFTVFITIFLFFTVLVSCSSDKHPLHDGYYSSEAAEFDSHGWKEYVTICVSNGRIILVEHNAFNKSGFIKSWDMDYMRVMNVANGTYPNAYTRYYGGRLLSRQGTQDVNALSGATHSYHAFIQLTEAALAKALKGDTTTSVVPLKEIN